MRKRLGELLIEAGVINEAQLQEALERGKVMGQRVGEALVSLDFASQADINNVLSAQLGLPVVDLSQMLILPSAVEALPESLARRYSVVPVDIEETRLTVASADPTNVLAEDAIQAATGYRVNWVLASPDDITRTLERAYSSSAERMGASLAGSVSAPVDSGIQTRLSQRGLQELVDTAPMSAAETLNSILQDAVAKRASHIHLEAVESGLRVRFVIDGILRHIAIVPKEVQVPMISRIRVMSNLGISESRRPEEGLGTFTVGNNRIHYRVSVLPTLRGEKLLISLFDPLRSSVTLDDLGLLPDQMLTFRSMLASEEGVILVTGPMASGKTTTLYAAINEIKLDSRDVITLEDPIESEIEWINQVQVNERAGLTFPAGLRAVLRQRPQVVMLSDLRDKETAEMAFRAAQGGQLILSSLRVNDAPAAISYLLHLGLPPYFIATALHSVISQRLVRKVHLRCKTTYTPDAETIAKYQLRPSPDKPVRLTRGTGCDECDGTGTLGRTGIFQILTMTSQLREVILSDPSEARIKEVARAEGMQTFQEVGLARALEGIIPIEEVPLSETDAIQDNLDSLIRSVAAKPAIEAEPPPHENLRPIRELVTL